MLIAALVIDFNSPMTKCVGLLFVIGFFYLMVVRPAFRKSKKDPLAKSPGEFGLARERSVERQMQNLLVELSEMARQITGQLDTRSAKLQALIAEADEKIALLGNLPGESARATFDSFKPDPMSGGGATLTVEPRVEAVDVRYQQIYALADDGQDAAEIARTLDQPRGEIELILALRSRS